MPPPRHVAFPPALPARKKPRRFLDPVGGWFRSLERRASFALSRWVFPRVPGMTLPYGAILSRALAVEEAELPLRGLHPDLDGARLLFVSDVHAGPFLAPDDLAAAFERLASLEPDVVVHGGDFATTRFEEVEPHAAAIRDLTAPLGAFAVLGNHDHYTGRPERVLAFLRSCGVRTLHNEAVAIRRGDGTLVLAGIDDWNIGKPKLADTLEAARALDAVAPIVVVSHNPDAFFEASAAGASAVVSGHTHGGQVRVPGLPVLVRMSRYRLDEGLYVHGGATLVVSRGLGASGIPLRLGVSPEAALITLRRVP
jgi:predicted MPP superfamily phosphohydrolase